jgi:hypothetical protein
MGPNFSCKHQSPECCECEVRRLRAIVGELAKTGDAMALCTEVHLGGQFTEAWRKLRSEQSSR